jgi:hypothetical protein
MHPQQQHAVGHVEYAFHLAAEVGVTWGVDDVDFCAFVVDCHVFGQRMVIPRSRSRSLLSRIRSPVTSCSLNSWLRMDHFVNKGGLAVVNVGDNGDVANVFHVYKK